MATSKTAVFLKCMKSWNSDAHLYELSTPLDGYKYVVVSAVDATFSGPETYIFGAETKAGIVKKWGELSGSFKGALNHAQALKNAGYEIVGKKR